MPSEPELEAQDAAFGGLAALDVDSWWTLQPSGLVAVGAGLREHYRHLMESRSGAALRPQAHEAVARVAELGRFLRAMSGFRSQEDAEDMLTSWAKASIVRLEVLREGVTGGGWASAQAMEDAFFQEPEVPEYLQPSWKHRKGQTQPHQQQQQHHHQSRQQQPQQQQSQPQPKAAMWRRRPH